MSHPATTKRFRVALSFPGDHRARVERIAEALAANLGRDKVLYDQWHAAEFARPNLDVYLPKLYNDESDLLVFFISKEYNAKEWCGLEWRAGLDLIKRREYGRLSQAPDSAASETAPLRSRLGGVRSRDRQGADR